MNADEAATLMPHVLSRLDELERIQSDHAQKFDTLETPLWRLVVFWADGWGWPRLFRRPVGLNVERPAWRPWRRWWKS